MPIDMITANGYPVDFSNIKNTKVHLNDIYEHIFNIRRYVGAIDVILAQHLYLCAQLIQIYFADKPNIDIRTKKIQKAFAVAHDFHEYLVTDIPTGLKRYLPEYQLIEAQAEDHVHNSIGLPLELRDTSLIKYIDLLALYAEMRAYGHPATDIVEEKVKEYCNKNQYTFDEKVMKDSFLQSLYIQKLTEDPKGFRTKVKRYFNQVLKQAVIEINKPLITNESI